MQVPLTQTAPEARHIAPAPVARRRILIVDDNQDAPDSLDVILQLRGHLVESAYTAEGALQQVTLFAPEVALLDIGLPKKAFVWL